MRCAYCLTLDWKKPCFDGGQHVEKIVVPNDSDESISHFGRTSWAAAYRAKRKLVGKCRECNRPISKRSKYLCWKHIVIRRLKQSKRLQVKKKYGICRRCALKATHGSYCQTHYEYQAKYYISNRYPLKNAV